MLAKKDYYRVAKNISEFVQDLTIFGRAAIDEEDMKNELLNRTQDNGLTLREELDGYFIDSVYDRCNIEKALSQRAEAIRREYEAFDIMYSSDGTFVKSVLSL